MTEEKCLFYGNSGQKAIVQAKWLPKTTTGNFRCEEGEAMANLRIRNGKDATKSIY